MPPQDCHQYKSQTKSFLQAQVVRAGREAAQGDVAADQRALAGSAITATTAAMPSTAIFLLIADPPLLLVGINPAMMPNAAEELEAL
jgi:hypothetical protein